MSVTALYLILFWIVVIYIAARVLYRDSHYNDGHRYNGPITTGMKFLYGIYHKNPFSEFEEIEIISINGEYCKYTKGKYFDGNPYYRSDKISYLRMYIHPIKDCMN